MEPRTQAKRKSIRIKGENLVPKEDSKEMCIFHTFVWMEGAIHNHKLLIWGYGLRIELELHGLKNLKMRTFSFEVAPGW